VTEIQKKGIPHSHKLPSQARRPNNRLGLACRVWVTNRSRIVYEFGSEVWTITRWLLLKLLSTFYYFLLGKNTSADRQIIEIGNFIFPSKYKIEMFQDYNSYINSIDSNLDAFLKMEPASTWLVGKDILDIGSGLGQYSNLLHKGGAKHVTGLEYQLEKKEWASSRWKKVSSIEFVHGSAEEIPFANSSFDTVFSHTVFEHVNDVAAALSEVYRILRPNGKALLSYNFFHNRGGHHLFPYIGFPWATWIVSEQTLCQYWSERLHHDQDQGEMLFYPREVALQSLCQGAEIHLNKLNFDEFEQLVRESGLRIDRRSCSDILGRCFKPLMSIPHLKYFLSGTIYYTLRKQSAKDMPNKTSRDGMLTNTKHN
jgi:SAM-dependent methyltransferase